MIQRIQSIWFLLAGITLSCLIFLPAISNTIGNSQYYILADGIYQRINSAITEVKATTPLLIMTIAIALMPIINIFNFKNRTRQKRLAIIHIVFVLALLFWNFTNAKQIPGGLDTLQDDLGIFFHPLAIIWSALGIRGINKDEKLIRSADRLR